jgi:hypothetical protein
MKTKKRIATVSVVLVLACAVIALYLYIDRSGKKAEEPVNTMAEQILAKDLEKNYPPTPYSVAEYYCGIVESIYSAETTEEQLAALGEAVRVTKKGGVIFTAYCGNDATILQFCFLRGMLTDEHYKALVDPVTFKAKSDPIDLFALHRPEEIDALRAHFAVTPLHLVSADGYTNYMRTTLAEMDEELYETYLRYHFATCERRDMLGYSNHYLDIFKKE